MGFFAFKREQNYLQNDTKFIVICFVLPEIFYFKQKINTISVTAPSYLTYLFINCDHMEAELLISGLFLQTAQITVARHSPRKTIYMCKVHDISSCDKTSHVCQRNKKFPEVKDLRSMYDSKMA